MSKKDDEGKLELSLRILGNEIIGFQMIVDDFKMKWMLLGLVAIGAHLMDYGTIWSYVDGDF